MSSALSDIGRMLARLAALLAVLGGLLVVVQLGLRWIVDGNGSSFVGRDLAGQLMYGRARPDWGPVGGIGIFAAALFGAWSIATATVSHRVVGLVRVGVGVVIAIAMVALSLTGAFEFDAWSIGPRLLAVGGLCLVVSGVIQSMLVGRVEAYHWTRVTTVGAVVAGCGAAAATVLLYIVASAGVEGGEPTPEAAVSRFVDAIDKSDLFAATSIVSGDEVGGVESALKELEGALRGSPALQGAAISVDASASIGRMVTRERAPGVAEVVTDVRLSAAVAGADTGVLGPLNQVNAVEYADFGFITVFEDGGWWVSPMLTAGEFLADGLDLPAGDYRRVSASDRDDSRLAATEQDAIEAVADGLSTANPSMLAAGVDAGGRRLLNVFEEAAQQLMDEFSSSWDVSIDSVDVTVSDTGAVAMTGLEGTVARYGGENRDLVVDGACPVDDSAALCLLDGLPLTGPLSLGDLPIKFATSDDGATVELLSTALTWVSVLAPRIDSSVVAATLGSEAQVPATSMAPGAPKAVSLGSGVVFANYEVPVTPGTPFSLLLQGDEGMTADVLTAGVDGEEFIGTAYVIPEGATVSPTIFSTSAQSVIVRVRSSLDCNQARAFTCTPTASAGSVIVRGVLTDVIDPDETLPVTLEPGQAMIVSFKVGNVGRYRLSTESSDLRVFYYYGESTTLSNQIDTLNGSIHEFDSGSTVTLALLNTGTAAGTFDFSVEEAPLPQGFAISNGRVASQVTVDLSSGARYVTVYFRPGTTVRITAVPNDYQDVTLNGDCWNCYYTDQYYDGGEETMSFSAGDSTSATITVDGWGSYNYYGTVTLYVTFS